MSRPWKTRTWGGDGEYGLNSKMDVVGEIFIISAMVIVGAATLVGFVLFAAGVIR